jgi:hypothetical protein
VALGDQTDFLGRLKAVLPRAWFPGPDGTGASQSPILDGVLAGFASMLAWVYALLAYAKLQTRIATATEVFLDIIALDYFGANITRDGQADATFRARILANLLAPKNTRAALTQALVSLTGRTPAIFEPANTSDTGGYGWAGMTVGSGLAYGLAGGYGSLALPFQAFVTAYRPHSNGIAVVAGYGSLGGFNGMPGGYGVGALEYASADQVGGTITDAQIEATIASTIPAATIAWTRIEP